MHPSKALVFISVSEKTACNRPTLSHQIVSCTQNPCNTMNDNTIYHLQPATKQQSRKLFCFYPTEANTTNNPLGVSDEAVEAMRIKPIGQRLVSCFVRSLVDGADYNGDLLPLGALLNADSPQVEALRIEPNWIEKKRMEDELPIYTPCCVLQCIPETRNYYPVNYTCLLDFDILQDDNPTINLDELKPELATLPQVYYCGLATNGIDLLCVVPISTPQRYAAHARALIHQFKRQGIIIRVADYITHTRTLSSDPSGHFNENAVEFTKFWD